MKKEKAIPYGRQFINEDDIKAVIEALNSDFLTQGPRIREFERKFASEIGSEHAVMVSNGTAALHLAGLALGVKPGDKIITTPITFAASANGFRYCGADICFCDIDAETYLIDLDKLEAMLEQAPKGIYKGVVPVDFAGYPVNAERMRNIADKHGLWVVEDACHAPGAEFTDSKGQRHISGSGSYADITVFSFHPVKHIATGEGGALTTSNTDLYNKLMLYRTHGITKDPNLLEENHGGWYYEMQELGYNYRITDFQAALGMTQLNRLNWSIQRRNEIAEKYNKSFADVKGVKIPLVAKDILHAYHLYVIQVDDRKGLYEYLQKNNIFAQVHYVPVHTMPYYKSFGSKKGDFPVAENYYAHCLSLPMYPTLTDDEQDYVINKVKEFLGE